MKRMIKGLLLLMCICCAVSAVAESNVPMIEVPFWDQYITCTDGAAEGDQYFSCFWAGMLLRRGGGLEKYLAALDSMGLKYTRKTDVTDPQTGEVAGVMLWFAEDLALAIYGDPVASASINLYPAESGMGASIPVDLDRNYVAMVAGEAAQE